MSPNTGPWATDLNNVPPAVLRQGNMCLSYSKRLFKIPHTALAGVVQWTGQ